MDGNEDNGLEEEDPAASLERKIREIALQKLAGEPRPCTRGLELYDDGDVEGALQEWRRVLAEKPDDHETWVHLGLALQEQGSFNEALNAYNNALAGDNKAFVYRCMGNLHAEMGNLDEAVESWKKAIDADPADLDSMLSIAMLLDREGGEGEREAREFYEKILELDPDHVAAAINLGVQLLQGDELEKKRARVLLERARERDPDNLHVLYNLGCAHALLGNKDEALALITRLLELSPEWKDDVAADEDFQSLHADPRFHELIY